MSILTDLGESDGGATYFPEVGPNGFRVQPHRGTAVVFFPTLMNGALNPHGRHAAEEVLGDVTKRVLQVWYAHGDDFDDASPVVEHA